MPAAPSWLQAGSVRRSAERLRCRRGVGKGEKDRVVRLVGNAALAGGAGAGDVA